MKEKRAWTIGFGALVILAVVILAGCGGGGTSPQIVTGNPAAGNPQASAATSTATLLIGDTPPAGVTVLSFSVTITGAMLQPGDVSLITKPTTVELRHLEATTALLTQTALHSGTYTDMTLTFANPKMTILNGTGSPIGNCAIGSICERTPALAVSSMKYSALPFPASVDKDHQLSLLLDFDLSNSISADLATITPTVRIGPIPLPSPASWGLSVPGEAVGLITGIFIDPFGEYEQIDLTTETGRVSMDFTSAAVVGFDTIGCTANDVSCLKVGQLVEVDMVAFTSSLSGDMWSLYASRIVPVPTYEEELTGELTGVITAINGASQFEMVALREFPDVAGVEPGKRLQVNLLPGTSFAMQGASPSGGLLFSAASDLLVGQTVAVRGRSAPAGTSLSVDADRVLLKGGAFSARVQSKLNDTDFVVDNLPGNFGNAPVTVRTNGATLFWPGSDFATLNVGDTVSLSGFLLKSANGPVLLAEEVRKR